MSEITKDQALLFFAEYHRGEDGSLGAIAEVALSLIGVKVQIDDAQIHAITKPYNARRKDDEKKRKAALKDFVL